MTPRKKPIIGSQVYILAGTYQNFPARLQGYDLCAGTASLEIQLFWRGPPTIEVPFSDITDDVAELEAVLARHSAEDTGEQPAGQQRS